MECLRKYWLEQKSIPSHSHCLLSAGNGRLESDAEAWHCATFLLGSSGHGGVGQQLDGESWSRRASAGLLGAMDLPCMFYSPLSVEMSLSEQGRTKTSWGHRKRAGGKRAWNGMCPLLSIQRAPQC